MLQANNAPPNLTTRWVLIAFSLIIGAIALWLVRDVIMLTLAAVVLSAFLSMPIHFLIGRGMRRDLAVIVSLVGVTVLVVLVVLLLLPGLIQQFNQLGTFIPQAIEQLQRLINSGQLLTVELPIVGPVDFDPNNILTNLDLESTAQQLAAAATTISSAVFPLLGSVASTIFSLLVILFMSLYFIADPETYRRGVVRLVPMSYRTRANGIVQRLTVTLRNYLQAQILLLFLIGLSTALALTLLGIPLAPTLGILTGLFSFVPNFGPITALIPVLAVTIVNSPENWLVVVVVFYGLQLIAGQVVAPLLMSDQIDIPAASILLGQIIASIFFGFIGLVLAVPLTAISLVLVEEVYIKDILGDRGAPLPEPADDPLDEELLPDTA